MLLTKLIPLLTIFLVSCGSRVKLPDAEICGLNMKSEPVTLRCYNVRTDYEYNEPFIQRKAKAKPRVVQVPDLDTLNGWIIQSPKDFSESRKALEKIIGDYIAGDMCR